jgi:hypothetical protein
MYMSCCNIPPGTNIIDPTKGATSEKWGGAGECNWSKHNYSTKTKLKIHVRQLRSITCPKICLWAPSKMPCTIMVLVRNPMVCSLSFTLGSSVIDEQESQIILGPPFLNARECEKLKNVGRATCGRPTLLTITKGG